MLTPGQEEWISHLSDSDLVKIVPFDVTAEEKFQKVKIRLQKKFGIDTRVEHHGATSLGVSGQDEIDVYIPVAPNAFNKTVDLLKSLFGEPKSLYPTKRARFVMIEDGKHIDVFPINEQDVDWKNLLKFEIALKLHPNILEAYKGLKEKGDGLSIREYYRRKLEFINKTIGL